MSEYQYYEFQAIDRPIDAIAQRKLRQITSRAQITSRSLINTYEWGDFKGNPRQLVEKYFDLFVYWANWGTRILMLRVPNNTIDTNVLGHYRVKDTLDINISGNFTIIKITQDIDEPEDDFFGEQTGISASFSILRNELIHGDLHCLYLGWLLGVQEGSVKDDAIEPPKPATLGKQTPSILAFTEFFGLDSQLLMIACNGSNKIVEPSATKLKAFIKALSEREKTELLCQAVVNKDYLVSAAIHRKWEQTQGSTRPRNRDERHSSYALQRLNLQKSVASASDFLE